ncbi:hypothetical protein DPMN_187091 [Dreissena polymorpha]|uniref:Uncharacterized protein n=1 Tax=Dreissena polymorpha TaxID=45954 RepID=A0A9D4DNU6_DREPO|nr:hypothetical protein DPMN_187091 [Dreissena polymorpha]
MPGFSPFTTRCYQQHMVLTFRELTQNMLYAENMIAVRVPTSQGRHRRVVESFRKRRR